MTDISEAQIFNQMDKETIDAQIRTQAEEIASAKIQELQSNLAKAVGVNPSEDKYASISAMKADMDRRAIEASSRAKEEAKSEIRAELEEEKRRTQEALETKAKQTVDEQNKEWANLTNEWKEAVADGIAPAISSALDEKLKSGVKYQDLTDEDRRDPGLVFYNQARQRHAELKRDGKAVSFYRTISQIDKKPRSASAPVFGGSVAMGADDADFTDSDLNDITNKVFKMGLPH